MRRALFCTFLLPATLLLAGCGGRSDGCDRLVAELGPALQIPGGWQVVRIGDLGADDRDLWKQHGAGQCPGVTAVDLDGDGRRSFAVALIQKAPGGRVNETLIHLQPGDNRGPASRTELDAVRELPHAQPVRRAPPGPAEDLDRGEIRQLKGDSILYGDAAGEQRRFYRQDGQFNSIADGQ